MQSVLEVGKKLVELSNQGKPLEAVDSLYGADIVSLEAPGSPTPHQRTEGIAAVRGKNQWWVDNHEVHECKVTGPWPHGERFIAVFKLDVTPKAGPMAGKRFTMEEAALYTVRDGKIVKEEFFYHMGG